MCFPNCTGCVEKAHRLQTIMSKTDTTQLKNDQIFKTLVHNKYILATMVGGLITDFEGLTREEVMDYLPLDGDSDFVVGSKTEMVSPSEGPVFLDSVFELRSPKGTMGLIVAIEGQGPWMDPKSLENRQLYYVERLLKSQVVRNGNKRNLYKNMKKIVCIWVHLAPSRELRNRAFRHSMHVTELGKRSKPKPSWIDRLEIIEVNVGSHKNNAKLEVQGMLNTLFDNTLNRQEKGDLLKEKYNIRLSESLIEEVENMGALTEEYEIALEEADERGFARGRAEGRAEGREEGTAQERERLIREYSDCVVSYCRENDVLPADAVEKIVILKDYRQPGLEAVICLMDE